MLIGLNIKNVAVIENLDVNFRSGVTAFTGETGAGKSIIIDSINMISGGRSSRELVRYGTDKATVQAIFDAPPSLLPLLAQNDIDAEDGEIIITRTINSEGKSTARINGIAVTLSALREIADKLINIHGQHDNQALLTPERHIEFLDAYASSQTLLNEYEEINACRKNTEKKLKSLQLDEKERMQKIDLLEYQINEITEAQLRAGEEEELNEERNLLANAEKIAEASAQAYANLYELENTPSAYDSISLAVNALSRISDVNPTLSALYERLNEAMYTIEDAAHEIREFGSETNYNPQRLNDIEQRLDTISKLKKKYGSTVADIIKYGEYAQTELDSITASDETLARLHNELSQTEDKLRLCGMRLSEVRKAAAKKLSLDIETALHELDMEKSKFEVQVKDTDTFEANGMNNVEFLISTNPGEPLKPLVKIASGGELSRVMLAIKSILAQSDSVGTLIFDEIDTGVSGSAAIKIAKKLRAIGALKQVICITHLPQMTAAANNHYLITKDTDGSLAKTTLTELDFNGRVEEIARIIDGNEVTETAKLHASEMIKEWN